jgi:hypothetical protein
MVLAAPESISTKLGNLMVTDLVHHWPTRQQTVASDLFGRSRPVIREGRKSYAGGFKRSAQHRLKAYQLEF